MKRKLIVGLVVVLALLLVAPSIVLYSPLRDSLLTKVVPPEVGTITVGRMSIGWLTPLTATNVTLFDVDGNRLADIGQLSIDRTVLGFLGGASDLGVIRLENATVYALARPDGSNIEDALARAAAASKPNNGDLGVDTGGPQYQLQIVNGRLLSRDAVTGQTWSFEQLAATIDHPANGPLRVNAAGIVRPAPVEAGGLPGGQPATSAGRFELVWGEDPAKQTDGFRMICQDLPVASCVPWFRRFDPQIAMAGVLSGELSASYPTTQYDSLSGDTAGRISLAKFAVTGTTLAGEQLNVEETNLAWKCTASGGRVSVENLSLASDVAMFDLRGVLDERVVRSVMAGTTHWHDLATRGDLEAEGKVNLARLAQRLPQLFKIREGTSITSGQVKFAARSMPQADGHQITASLNTTPLAGTTRGQAIRWDAPLDIDVVARHTATDWRFDNVSCRSKFLEVTGSGDARQMQLAGRVDLDELTSRLDQFVDLTDWQLAGRGEINGNCRRDGTGQFVASATGTLSDFVIAHHGAQMVTEPQLNWSIETIGASPATSIWPDRLMSAEVTLHAAGDNLELQLTQPTVLGATWSATDWPVHIATTGNLTGWTRRLRPWVDLSQWNTAGQLKLDARGRVRATPLVATIAESQLTIDQLRAVSAKYQIEEPRVQWSGDIAWDSTTSTLVSRAGQLVSSTVAASFRDWYWTADPKQTSRVGGLAAVRMDLGRLARAQRPTTGQPPGMQPVGQMNGTVKLAAQGGQVVAAVDLAGQNIEIQKPQPALPGAPPTMKAIWREPSLRLVGTVSYAPDTDSVRFDGLQTQSSTFALAASGSIEGLRTNQMTNLAGTIDYDLASLSPIIAQYIGEGLQMVGREQARFEFRGALAALASGQALASTVAPAQLASNTFSPSAGGNITSVSSVTNASNAAGGIASWYGRVLAPWQSASFYGLPIGQGRLSAELTQGRVLIEPLDFAVGGGRLTAAPAIRLTPAPGELTLPAGPLLTNVTVTPDVSERMLKYIVPYVASSTQTDGTFSMTLSGGRVPLGAPTQCDVAGRLDVHTLRVAPGPSLGELASLASQIEGIVKGKPLLGGAPAQPITLLSMSQRSIDFRVVDGRVYHQGLEFQVGNLVFRSRGSVGLDQTISAMLEVQLPAEGRLRNVGITKIEVPVSGTLGSMKIDTSAALQGLLQQAGGNLLNDENIGNAINKLLGGGR
ncbi:hypothetical protein [Aeoliella sp. SH292]|uniref:hypothetical protein n=1 Tax=Aeoliella sp. SH292 TaxID=3454464 RepID=UPI003F96EE4D